jgi:bifunctional NMN adenylyltransferase/nudix hydrolase
MNKEYSIGAVVGRFQIHELHDAHKYLIDQVVLNHKKSIVFLGVPKVVGTKKNPLDFDTRKKMIQSQYPDTVILALPDIGDDTLWSQELDKRIREVYSIGDVLLYGGRDSFIPYYKKGRSKKNCL